MSVVPLVPEPSPFVEVAEAARLAGMSEASIKRRCARDGLGFKPGGRGPWRIRRATFEAWLNGKTIR